MAKLSLKLGTNKAFQNRAEKTEEAIEAKFLSDGGASFRAGLKKWLPTIEDAYREETSPHRKHLGASLIGTPCARALWYGFRWATLSYHQPRVMRLFNRGHLEEARFMSMLEMIGVTIHLQEDGGQERISAYGGHFGSALDGVLYNVPDCPGEWVLGEYKTYGTKPFSKLANGKGVAAEKPQHFAQMQVCMHLRGIHKCLYMAVNKNDDDLYCEIVAYNQKAAEAYLRKAGDIIFSDKPPLKYSKDATNMECRFCDHADICHYGGRAVEKNCRTCKESVAKENGTWHCLYYDKDLSTEDQRAGEQCESYAAKDDFYK
jgi:hypothetical protein